MVEKHEFASPQWVKCAERFILDLAKKAGDSANNADFTMCEAYYNAPTHLSDGNRKIGWYFRIKGRKISVETGDVDDVDFKVIGDYEVVKQISRLFHGNPEDMKKLDEITKRAVKNGKLKAEGSRRKGPKYLFPLHNLLAEITK